MISSDANFKTAIYNALCSCLSLQPSSSEAKAMIREAYNEPEVSPRPARTTDVFYWEVSPNDQIPDPVSYGTQSQLNHQQKAVVSRNLSYILHLVCYGPSCEIYVNKFRSFLYVDGDKAPRQILRKAGIYLVPDPGVPEYLYEPEGSLWRRRADLNIEMVVRDQMIFGTSRGTVQSGPYTIIKH